MKAVIIAAGIGSRIEDETDGLPKTILPFEDGTILSTIMKNISQTGINEFVIIVGYKYEQITNYLDEEKNFGYDITIVKNEDWQKGNGISVLAAENAVADEEFILSMSDHIVSVNALNRIVNFDSDKNLLLVDPNIHDNFDIDDATKVDFEGIDIINIGKELKSYNGLDCGIFRLNKNFFSGMRRQLELNNESISASINELIKDKDMQAVLINNDDYWFDIDTPEAYKHCINTLRALDS